ncbi:MAG: hypothetical protein Q9226_007577 [Calogaya cf. arnoldii]
MATGPQLQEAFVPHSLSFDASGISGFDSDICGESQHGAIDGGLSSTNRPEMEWSTNLNQDVFQTCYHSEPVHSIETLDFGDIHHVQSLSNFDFSPFLSTATDPPQTIAPRKTIVYHNACWPAMPNHSLSQPSHTPELGLEHNACSSPPVSPLTPVDPPREGSPMMSESPVCKHEELEENLTRVPSKRTRKVRKTREPTTRWRSRYRTRNVGSITVHDAREVPHSKSKKYRCEPCNMSFDRPEHYKRHVQNTESHDRIQENLGLPVESGKDPKPFKCKVPDCIERGFAGVTRKDNLKPHYQKTHFFGTATTKESKDGKDTKKRNAWVSAKYVEEVLGLGEWDPRTDYGEKSMENGKPPRIDPCNYDHMSDMIHTPKAKL